MVRAIDTYDWLDDGETCLKGDSVGEFEAALRRVLDDADERERIGANARETSERFTLDAVGEDLVGLYDQLASENAIH